MRAVVGVAVWRRSVMRRRPSHCRMRRLMVRRIGLMRRMVARMRRVPWVGITWVRRMARVRMAGMVAGMTGMTGVARMMTWMVTWMTRMMTWMTRMWLTVVGRLTVMGIVPVQRLVLHGLLGVERDLRFLEARLGIQAFGWDRHGSKLGIVGRRWEVVAGRPSRKIRYQVEMLSCRCRDAE